MAERVGFGRRITATLSVGIGMGLVVGLVAALIDFAAGTGGFVLTPMVLVHAGVAAILGAGLAAFFGRGGILGWLIALALGALITAVASFVAPILGPSPDLDTAQAALDALPRDVSQIELEAFTLPLALISSPFLGLLWGALISAVHAAAGGARQG